MTLGGNVCVRNGNRLDYCWRESIQSLLPVCDEVVVCDGESTDGTQEEIRDWMKREPKIKLCVYPWPNPEGDPDFWVKWLNFAREHIESNWQIQLDADEVLSEQSYGEVLAKAGLANTTLFCKRYNFWQDHRHLIPPGVCLSHRVLRIAPKHVWLPSDGAHHKGSTAVAMGLDTTIEIFHYGFLRKREAYFAKSKELHRMFFNTYDQRLVDAEAKGGNWMREIGGIEWNGDLVPYDGHHPKVIHQWLRERNYDV